MASGDRSGEPKTAVEMWRRRVERSPSKVAWRWKRGGAWTGMTFGEADTAAREVAAGLAALGMVPGDHVAVLAQTRVEWVLADIGVLLGGGVVVPIYASNTAEVCEFILRDAAVKFLIVEDAAQVEKIASRSSNLPGLAKVIHIAGDVALDKPDASGRTRITIAEACGATGEWVTSWDALRSAGRTWLGVHPEELSRRGTLAQPATMFTIIYTSGTTGHPKGVVLSHENLVSSICSAVRALDIGEDDEQFIFLPLAHVLARELEWATIEAGLTTWLGEGVPKVKENLADVRPTFMAAVPRVFEKFYAGVQSAAKQGSPLRQRLMAWAFATGAKAAAARRAGQPGGGLALALADKLVLAKLRAKLGLGRCRFLISGGAPLAPEIAEFFHGVGLLVLEGYGLTETTSAAYLNTRTAYRFGTVGPPLDVIEGRIAPDGEILLRGPSVFKEYFNNAAATADAIDGEGWFHSGDIGELQDGFLRITDRKKDLIVTSGGKKIAPGPLENALKTRSPLISQALVFGDKRPCCVALLTVADEVLKARGGAEDPGLRAEIGKAVEALNGTLASYETIKAFKIMPADWSEATGELTPSLKVKRKEVVEKFAAAIEGLYR